MNTYNPIKLILQVIVVVGIFFVVSAPSPTFAATTPTCVLTIETSEGTIKIDDEGDVLLHKGDTIKIEWKSKNATKATISTKGKIIALQGTSSYTPSTTRKYSYHFSQGSQKVECSVLVHVVTGSFTTSTLTTNSTKPTISGKAEGTKSVSVVITKMGSTKPLYTSREIKVQKGVWKTKVTKKLPNGVYSIRLFGEKGFSLNTIASSTLAIGKNTRVEEKVATTLVVVPVPLLLGGTARAGTSIAVSYLQVINVGKAPTTMQGFSVKQNGSASSNVVTELTIVDDSGSARGSTIASGSTLPFKNNVAFVPVNTLFAPGQMRLFTIKAVLSSTVSAYFGTQLKIDVTGIDTTASVKGAFPIRGTTWTIGS